MARRVRDKGLESRSARTKLEVSGRPYYKAIGEVCTSVIARERPSANG
jgi:hypothetical protein